MNNQSVSPMPPPAIECRCAGEDREMGLAQGRALRTKILGIRQSLRELEAFRVQQPKWLPYPLFLSLSEWKAERALTAALRRFAPAMLDRLEGIAAGAGASLRTICLMNVMEAFLGSCEGKTVPAPLGGCSALAIRRSRSANGEPIVAKNFDYLPLVQPFFMLRESRPRSGWRSLDFTVAPQGGTVDGVNEQGLCITLNYAYLTDAAHPAPLITMVIAEALARCSTVAEAVEHITQRPRWGAGILMLADAAGDLASLELSNSKAAVRRPAQGEDWLTFTNVCRCPETCAVQVPKTAVYSDQVPRPLRGQPVLQWHIKRAGRIEELVRLRGTLGSDEVAAVMADHGPRGLPDGASPCVHTDYWRTTAALQWFPARRSVRAWYGTACTAKYVELAL
jgi:predicted choloylglycine hydrolase